MSTHLHRIELGSPEESHLHNVRRAQVAESVDADIFKIQIDIHWTVVSLNDVHFVHVQRINFEYV